MFKSALKISSMGHVPLACSIASSSKWMMMNAWYASSSSSSPVHSLSGIMPLIKSFSSAWGGPAAFRTSFSSSSFDLPIVCLSIHGKLIFLCGLKQSVNHGPVQALCSIFVRWMTSHLPWPTSSCCSSHHDRCSRISDQSSPVKASILRPPVILPLVCVRFEPTWTSSCQEDISTQTSSSETSPNSAKLYHKTMRPMLCSKLTPFTSPDSGLSLCLAVGTTLHLYHTGNDLK
mmetsp:Transcript_64351/g.184777  ORF Transcript_64351/g.184777 Transcript_64351/m.184777 type:complete len:232 (-) Transcript_64351:158-853(-)